MKAKLGDMIMHKMTKYVYDESGKAFSHRDLARMTGMSKRSVRRRLMEGKTVDQILGESKTYSVVKKIAEIEHNISTAPVEVPTVEEPPVVKLTERAVAKIVGISHVSVHQRKKRGESFEEIIKNGSKAKGNQGRTSKKSPLTQAEVARRIGLSPSAVSLRFNNGESLDSILKEGRLTNTGPKPAVKTPALDPNNVSASIGLSRAAIRSRESKGETLESILQRGRLRKGDIVDPTNGEKISVMAFAKKHALRHGFVRYHIEHGKAPEYILSLVGKLPKTSVDASVLCAATGLSEDEIRVFLAAGKSEEQIIHHVKYGFDL